MLFFDQIFKIYVLLDSLAKDMHWKAECEAAEIKISPSKSEALVLR